MKLIDMITISRNHFFFFVDRCNDLYRSGHDLRFYKEIISMHRENSDLGALINSEIFCKKIYRTLEKWDMNQRGARLAPFEIFRESIIANKYNLFRLYKYKLYDNLDSRINTVITLFKNVFSDLKVMESKRKIVGVSKTLHFLLPDLVMPIDSKYTMPAFYGYNKYSNDTREEFKTFKDIFKKTHQITRSLNLSPSDANGDRWKTSVPKLIDNAIIGFFKSDKVIQKKFERYSMARLKINRGLVFDFDF